MKKYTQDLLERINNEIQVLDLEEDDIFKKSLKATSLLEKAFNELKVYISEYSFKNETDEIQFFKDLKPQIFSKLIYYSTIYKIEMNRPTGSDLMQKTYTLKQLDRLKVFFDNNIDFYKYYRTGSTDLDKQYFLRGKPDIHLNLDSFYFERDPKFFTGFDSKVAKILANDMLSIYLNAELSKLEEPSTNKFETTNFPNVKVTWTDSKVALVELIYAIYSTGSINNGNSDLKSLGFYFENVFNIELGDIYRTYLEIRGRKGNRVQYLDELRKRLIARMDEVDNM
ncbi:MAG: RteC domain-containing protein [Sulfuricurvum sp.]|nr:RteC domain-containing protein [Sulfuricurvum sp.]